MELKNKTNWIIYFSLILLTFLFFYPVLNKPALYLDDYQNIFAFKLVDTSLSLKGMWQALTYNLAGIRPLSYLTIYLSNTIFGINLKALLIFNLMVHIINSLLFYKIALKLTNKKEIAFITAALWAISPINVFAVIYIIQRMTSLAVLFGNLAFLSFLNYMETENKKSLLLSFLLVFIATLFKENGILYLGVFLAYFSFYKDNGKSVTKLYILSFLTLILYYFICVAVFKSQYFIKDINPLKRFITEFKVLVFYLKNIILPTRDNIFLFLYMPVSKSLFSPVSTLLSGIIITVLSLVPWFLKNKNKLIAFSIFSFFIFHVMESTFLPLEIIFLHRNYAASFFIILIAVYVLSKTNSKIRIIVFSLLFFNFLYVGLMHNTAWTYPEFYYQYNASYYPENPQLKMIEISKLINNAKYEKALKKLKPFATKLRYTFVNRQVAKILLVNGKYNDLIRLSRILPKEDHLELYFIAKAYENLQNFNLAEKFYLQSLKTRFMPSVFENYITFLYNNDYYDKVVFTVEQHQEKLDKSLKLTKEYATLTYLTYLECLYRINLTTNIPRIESKLLSAFPENRNIAIYLKVLKLLKEKKYNQALQLLKKIKLNSFDTLNLFINSKKDILIACCYAKLNQEEKLRNYLDKHSANPIIYTSILRGLDKCY